MRDLPPLKAIRAFEACYRLGSYTRAAAALNVQQPAISHQIRQLEQDLGLRLFAKSGTAMLPTEPAHEYYQVVSRALGDIQRASIRLRRKSQGDSIALATYPGLASFWALPRLAGLREQAPDCVVRMTTAELDQHIPLDDVDCAILFGDGHWPGFDSALLIPEKVQPVASPALAEKLRGLSPEALLARGPLIHLDDPEQRWFTWFDWQQRFAPEAEQLDKTIIVSNHGIALHQAIQGQGVALSWTEMIADLLHSETLVALHQQPLQSARGYFFLSHPEFGKTEACRLLAAALGVP